MSDIKKILHEIKIENIDFSKIYTSGADEKMINDELNEILIMESKLYQKLNDIARKGSR